MHVVINHSFKSTKRHRRLNSKLCMYVIQSKKRQNEIENKTKNVRLHDENMF